MNHEKRQQTIDNLISMREEIREEGNDDEAMKELKTRTLSEAIRMIEPPVIETAWYTNEIDEHEYSQLKAKMSDGTERAFHFPVGNPMPKPYVVEGHTWEWLCGCAQGMCRIYIDEYVKVRPGSEFHQTIRMKNKDYYNNLMDKDRVDYAFHKIEPDSVVKEISYTIPYTDFKVEIRVHSGHQDTNLWCDAVLSKDGRVLDESETRRTLEQAFELAHGNDKFYVNVI